MTTPQSSMPPAAASSAPAGGSRPPYGGPRSGGPRGAPRPGGPGGPGGRPRGGGRYAPRRRVCSFCVDHVTFIDYKDVDRLRRYVSDRAKMEPPRKTGVCASHQRLLSEAIKRARHMALLPFVPTPGMNLGYRR